MVAEVVRVERGRVDEGAEVSRSVYDMNESRFVETWGEGGWERLRGDTGNIGGDECCAVDTTGSGYAAAVGVGCTSVLDSFDTDPPKQLVVGVGEGTAVASALRPDGALSFCGGP